MNTPTISPILPGASNPVARAPQGSAEPDTHPASFSQVLDQQHAAQGTAQAAATAPADPGRGQSVKHAGKDQPAPADDEALAEAAGEQVLTLAQIALGIAAEAAAVQLPAAQIQGHGAQTSDGKPVAGRPNATTLAAALPADASLTAAAGLRTTTAQAAATQPQPAASDMKATPLDALLKPAAAAQPAVDTATLRGRATAGDPIRANVPGTAAKARSADLVLTPQGTEAGHSKAVADFTAAMTAAGSSVAASGTAAPDAASALASALSAAASAVTTPTASANLPPSGAPTLAPLVATPLQSPLWAGDFSRQFVSITQAGHAMPHTAELRLDPPDLGPLRIAIQITDSVAHAAFISPHAAVRQTVENALPQLQELLAQAGISLGQTSVSDQGQPGQTGQQGNDAMARPGSAIGSVAGTETGNAPLHAATRARAPDALVDTFA